MTRLLGLRVAPMISLDRPCESTTHLRCGLPKDYLDGVLIVSRLADSECRSSGASPMIVILLQYPVATRCGADARSDSQLLKSWPPEIQNAPSSPQQLLHSTSGNMHLTATFILLACVLLQAVNGIPTPTVDEQTLSHKGEPFLTSHIYTRVITHEGGTALDTSFSALDDVGGSRESDLVLSSDSYGNEDSPLDQLTFR